MRTSLRQTTTTWIWLLAAAAALGADAKQTGTLDLDGRGGYAARRGKALDLTDAVTMEAWIKPGKFGVDVTWRRGGLAEATIRSDLGRRCRVRYGEKLARFDTRAGECYRLDAELRRK